MLITAGGISRRLSGAAAQAAQPETRNTKPLRLHQSQGLGACEARVHLRADIPLEFRFRSNHSERSPGPISSPRGARPSSSLDGLTYFTAAAVTPRLAAGLLTSSATLRTPAALGANVRAVRADRDRQSADRLTDGTCVVAAAVGQVRASQHRLLLLRQKCLRLS